jgi:AsmA protein
LVLGFDANRTEHLAVDWMATHHRTLAVNGPFDAVGWQIQWSAVVQGAVTQRLKDGLRDRLEEQLGLTPKPASAAAGAGATGPAAPASPKALLQDALRKWLK